MKVGTVCYATKQGLGYLAKSFFDNKIITDPIIWLHRSKHRTDNFRWYPDDTPTTQAGHGLERYIRGLDAMIFFETPFNWNLLRTCKRYGVRTILMPMYEWTPQKWPAKPDVLFCPSVLDRDYFIEEYGKDNCVFTPVPVETKHWKLRKRAVNFLHNGGNIGYREHKGTRQLLESVQHVQSPDFRLRIRAQDTSSLRAITSSISSDHRVEIEYGEIPYEELWNTADVYVAAEKFNGLSLPLQEAFAAGLPVMTTNRYPMNTWLPTEIMFPAKETITAQVSRNCLPFEECIVDPKDIAHCIDRWVNADITELSEKGREWAASRSWEVLKPFYQDAIEKAVKGEPCPSY